MEQRISIDRLEQAVNLFGSFDENIRLIEEEFSVTVVNRDGELRVTGEPEDTMLAVKTALKNDCKEVFLYGGTGGARLDHTLANLQALLYLRRRGARGWMYDRDFLWTVIENEALTVERTVEWGLLSAFCLGADASGVDEQGVQYPLKDATLTAEFPLGVSNHILEPQARVTVRNGALAVGWQLAPVETLSLR